MGVKVSVGTGVSEGVQVGTGVLVAVGSGLGVAEAGGGRIEVGVRVAVLVLVGVADTVGVGVAVNCTATVGAGVCTETKICPAVSELLLLKVCATGAAVSARPKPSCSPTTSSKIGTTNQYRLSECFISAKNLTP